MSDLLLETMSDAQIEAVFAHELGHIVHKHMWWYLVFVAIFLFTMAGPGDWLVARLDLPWVQGAVMEIVLTGIAVVGFLLAFGFVSRRFERQADVFAARALQREAGIGALDTVLSEDHSPPPTWSYVGPYGATLFGGALQRVAVVNNIPVSAPSWCHGSIRKRMTYLEQLGMDPARTRHFDGFMQWLYRLLMLTLLVTMGWTIIAGL